jgi:hypothetical protein
MVWDGCRELILTTGGRAIKGYADGAGEQGSTLSGMFVMQDSSPAGETRE